jgi:hypothetical protein
LRIFRRDEEWVTSRRSENPEPFEQIGHCGPKPAAETVGRSISESNCWVDLAKISNARVHSFLMCSVELRPLSHETPGSYVARRPT